MSAKRPETRERRLEVLIESSEQQQGVPPLERPGIPAALRADLIDHPSFQS